MRINLLLLIVICLLGCEKTEDVLTDCGILRCPVIRNTIYLSVKDVNGNPTEAAYIETYNTRTKKKEINLQTNSYGSLTYEYPLFRRPRDFSFVGDSVVVLLKSKSGKEFTLNYIIKGGNCTCEVQKVSGPDSIVID